MDRDVTLFLMPHIVTETQPLYQSSYCVFCDSTKSVLLLTNFHILTNNNPPSRVLTKYSMNFEVLW